VPAALSRSPDRRAAAGQLEGDAGDAGHLCDQRHVAGSSAGPRGAPCAAPQKCAPCSSPLDWRGTISLLFAMLEGSCRHLAAALPGLFCMCPPPLCMAVEEPVHVADGPRPLVSGHAVRPQSRRPPCAGSLRGVWTTPSPPGHPTSTGRPRLWRSCRCACSLRRLA
jgi:hypothetical protein